MSTLNAVFPLAADRLGAARPFAKELNGPRRQKLEDLERRSGVEREIWTINQIPDDSHVILVRFDSDVEKTCSELASADGDFTAWYCAQVPERGGLDRITDDQAASEDILEWNAS